MSAPFELAFSITIIDKGGWGNSSEPIKDHQARETLCHPVTTGWRCMGSLIKGIANSALHSERLPTYRPLCTHCFIEKGFIFSSEAPPYLSFPHLWGYLIFKKKKKILHLFVPLHLSSSLCFCYIFFLEESLSDSPPTRDLYAYTIHLLSSVLLLCGAICENLRYQRMEPYYRAVNSPLGSEAQYR